MSEMMVHDLDDKVRNRLQELARTHGRSLDEEIRDILRMAVEAGPSEEVNEGLGTRISRRFAGIGLEQDIRELRGHLVKAPSFDA